ncbi:TolC family protein [Henriciella barbarensis]|uniref:TolC family protein n=1 Tax=Henriciella barbarensis TaxID=86342 RepID=A0A399QY64_9PROT|nr:TolC family protein [Henriciella barbarensis]RIJ22477.1 TolC family protein [Henriciella barbarensis]
MTINLLTRLTKRPITRRLLAASALLALSLPAAGQALSADDAAQLAKARPEAAQLIDAPVERAEGNLQSARTLPNPVASLEREGVDGFGGDGAETIVSIEQSWDFSGRRTLNQRGAEADIEAARFNALSRAANLGVEARRSYFELLAARKKLSIAARYESELSNLLNETARREQAGDAARYDVERVRQETLAASIALTEAETELYTAEQSLAALIGAEPLAGQVVLTDALLPDTVISEAYSVAASPVIRALQAEAEGARWRRESASKFMPDITFGAGVRQTEGLSESTGLLFSLSVPLPLFDRNQGEYRARAADVNEAEARVRLTEAQLASEIASLRNRAQSLIAATDRYESGALSSATELREIAQSAFNGGEIAVFEIIDALQSARDAELRTISLQHDARKAVLDLAELLPETEQ